MIKNYYGSVLKPVWPRINTAKELLYLNITQWLLKQEAKILLKQLVGPDYVSDSKLRQIHSNYQKIKEKVEDLQEKVLPTIKNVRHDDLDIFNYRTIGLKTEMARVEHAILQWDVTHTIAYWDNKTSYHEMDLKKVINWLNNPRLSTTHVALAPVAQKMVTYFESTTALGDRVLSKEQKQQVQQLDEIVTRLNSHSNQYAQLNY